MLIDYECRFKYRTPVYGKQALAHMQAEYCTHSSRIARRFALADLYTHQRFASSAAHRVDHSCSVGEASVDGRSRRNLGSLFMENKEEISQFPI